jgi:hypothetical protein
MVAEPNLIAQTFMAAPGQAVICRFSGVSKSKVRATLSISPDGVDTTDAVVVPAQ